jgi:hypothetical protein
MDVICTPGSKPDSVTSYELVASVIVLQFNHVNHTGRITDYTIHQHATLHDALGSNPSYRRANIILCKIQTHPSFKNGYADNQ